MEQTEPKQYTAEQFAEMYKKLCKTTGYTLVAHPEFKYRDDNTFSVMVVFTIEKIPEANGRQGM